MNRDVYELTTAYVTAARSIALNNDKQYILTRDLCLAKSVGLCRLGLSETADCC